jgi:tetratricopeptide (TPR) repeat protein
VARPAEAPATVFVSYSHHDEAWKEQLCAHLSQLDPARRIEPWDDRQIGAGDEWYEAIRAAMERAGLAVCLVSRDYLVSDFVRREEIPYLLARRAREGLCIVPVLLHPCKWQEVHWLKPLQLLPRDGRSVTGDFAGREDEVFAAVARRVLEIISDPQFQPPPAASPAWPPPHAVDINRLPMTGFELFGRQAQLALLDQAWRSYDTHVVSFVGWGGVGKSTLVRKWLEAMAGDNYRGAWRVFAWSFFSQGMGQRVTSADYFVDTALEWFGDPRPTEGSPWDKGERLAELIRQDRTLLVLDGLEPLQSAQDFERGRILDPALATLIAELARENPGLCVITTREAVADLVAFPRTTTQENLEHLSAEAARALLRVRGVRGSDGELETEARRLGNHALALELLAGYLGDSPGHRVADGSGIPLLDLPESSGRNARSVMAAFAERFGPGPEGELLRLLGLFDRPATPDQIRSLRSPPVMPGLTERLVRISEAEWLRLLDRLRRVKLLAEEDRHAPETLDAHPLVREHFRDRLRAERPDAWRAGNSRLFEHLQRRAPRYPETLEEMAPLLAAVIHGCEAGRHQEALDLHYERVQRRGNTNFITTALGAFGTDLAVLSFFFDAPWQRPAAGLVPQAKVALPGWIGYRLRALGRLTEAAEAMHITFQGRVEQGDFSNAALEASNLCQVHLLSGEIPRAVEYGQQAVDLADRGTDAHWQMGSRCTLADAWHQAGRLEEAVALFARAEEINRRIYAQWPFLYSFQGYAYCDLLLTLGRHGEVRERADRIVRWAMHRRLDVGLGHLAMGQAELVALQRGEGGDPEAAEASVNEALDVLRQAGEQDQLPSAFLVRATLHRLRGRADEAEHDLARGLQLAGWIGLRLRLADCHLEGARLHLSIGSRELAREACRQARQLIEGCGYRRRDDELREVEARLD